MKTLKTTLALCLVMLMMISALSVSAFAAQTNLPASDWESGTITATLVSGETVKPTVTGYQVITVNTEALLNPDTGAATGENQPKEPEYAWASESMASWMQTNYPAYTNDTTKSVVEQFGEAAQADIDSFYDKLEAAIEAGTVSGLPTVSFTVADKNDADQYVATATGVKMGSYLITAKGGTAVYLPTVANIIPEFKSDKWVVESAASTTMKGSPVSIDKEITSVNGTEVGADEAKAAIGDTVSYTIVADVPNYPANSVSLNYTITDTISAGLTLDTTSVKIKIDSNDVTETIGDKLTAAGQEIKLDLSGKDNYAGYLKGHKTVTITYDVTVNGNAVVGPDGNPNTVVLDYSNDPYVTGSSKTIEDDCIVYTYGINVLKVDKKTPTKTLKGAEFTMKLNGTELTFTKSDDGYYYPDAAGSKVLVSGDDGKILVKGLNEGTYTLTETKAPNGYALASGTVEVVIVDAKTTNTEGELVDGFNGKPEGVDATGAACEYEDGMVPVTITNTEGYNLPSTGGAGTIAFTVLGILFFGCGALLVIAFIRKRTNKA